MNETFENVRVQKPEINLSVWNKNHNKHMKKAVQVILQVAFDDKTDTDEELIWSKHAIFLYFSSLERISDHVYIRF